MAINTLCAAFRRIAVGRLNAAAARKYSSTEQLKSELSVMPGLILSGQEKPHSADSVTSVKFAPRTLNIDFGTPVNGNLIRNIIEMPIGRISPLREPETRLPVPSDCPVPEKSLDLPTNGQIIEKQAVRLIVIRRKKIKKHKRRKLRKRMKFEWQKIRIKRNQEREKLFQAELVSKIKEAQVFDAKKYVQERLNILNKERIPRLYRGEILPADMIKKFLDEKKAKKEAKRNKPRLKL